MAALTAAMLLFGAACGGGSDKTAGDATATPRTAAAATATRPAASTAAASTTTGATATTAPASPSAGASATPAPSQPTATVPAAVPTPPQPAPTEPRDPGPVSITVVALNVKFSPTSIIASAGAPITVTLDNQDTSVQHDIEFFSPSGGKIAGTDLATGPATNSVTFTIDAPGTYPFKCSVHPQAMHGALIVQ